LNEKDFSGFKAKERLRVIKSDDERNLNQEKRETLMKEMEEREKEGRGGGEGFDGKFSLSSHEA